jgi:hypothetical protein
VSFSSESRLAPTSIQTISEVTIAAIFRSSRGAWPRFDPSAAPVAHDRCFRTKDGRSQRLVAICQSRRWTSQPGELTSGTRSPEVCSATLIVSTSSPTFFPSRSAAGERQSCRCGVRQMLLIRFAMQLCPCAVRAFKVDVQLLQSKASVHLCVSPSPEIRRSTTKVWSSSQLPLTASMP